MDKEAPMTDVVMRRTIAMIVVALTATLAVALVHAQPSQASRDKDAGELSTANRTQRMTIKAGKFYISQGLKHTYGNVWKNGSHKTFKACRNVSRVRVRCNVGWLSGHYIYFGKAFAYYRYNDPDHYYYNISGIRRKHVSAEDRPSFQALLNETVAWATCLISAMESSLSLPFFNRKK